MDFIEMIESLVKPLLKNQSALSVREIGTDEGVVSFEILVDNEDLGRVIGREGRVANALRTVAYASAIKEGFKIRLNFDAQK